MAAHPYGQVRLGMAASPDPFGTSSDEAHTLPAITHNSIFAKSFEKTFKLTHRQHLPWSEQPFERGAAAGLKRLNRQFAESTFLHLDLTSYISRDQHRDKPAEIWLVADE